MIGSLNRETRQSRVSLAITNPSRSISLRVSLRGPDAGAAISSSSADLWLAVHCTTGNFDGAQPGSPCTPDPHDRPNCDSRDGENHRLVLVRLLGVVVPP
jgi:hypothetical protein